MLRRPGEEYYRQRLRLPGELAALTFVFFWGVGFGSAVVMAPLPIGLLFGCIGWGAALAVLVGVAKVLRRTRKGLRVTSAGLHEVCWLGEERFIPWSAVTAVKIGDAGATLHTRAGSLELGHDLAGWLRLAKRARNIVDGTTDAPPCGDRVDPDEVADWLGVRPGEALECRARGATAKSWALLPVWLVVTGALAAFYTPFFWGAFQAEARMRLGMLLFTCAHAAIFFGVFSGGLLIKILQGFREALSGSIIADGSGLSVGGAAGWRHYAWSEIHGLQMRDGVWQVAGDDGGFTIPAGLPYTGRLVNALQQAVAARRAGRILPAGGPIPETALSRAGDAADQAAAERGLSVAGETDEAALTRLGTTDEEHRLDASASSDAG